MQPVPARLRNFQDGFLAFSPKGKWLASSADDGLALLWNLDLNGLPIILANSHSIPDIAFSSDGNLLAVSSQAGVAIWTVSPSARVQATVAAYHVTKMAFADKGKILAVVSNDNSLTLWDVASGSLESQHLIGASFLHHVAISQDSSLAVSYSCNAASGNTFSGGGTLEVCSPYGPLSVWSVPSGQLKAILTPHAAADGDTAALSPDGLVLAVANFDGSIELWDVATGKLKEQLRSGKLLDRVNALAFGPDGKTLAALGTVTRIWEVGNEDVAAAVLPGSVDNGILYQVALSADGRSLAAIGCSDNSTQLKCPSLAATIWDLKNHKMERRFSGLPGSSFFGIPDVAISPDGRKIAMNICTVVSDSCSVEVVQLRDVSSSARADLPLGCSSCGVKQVEFSSDGTMIAALRTDDVLVLWDASTLRSRRFDLSEVSDGKYRVQEIALSPDDMTVASVGTASKATASNPEMCLWDVSDGKLRDCLVVGSESAGHLVYASNSRQITLLGKSDASFETWDMSNHKKLSSQSFFSTRSAGSGIAVNLGAQLLAIDTCASDSTVFPDSDFTLNDACPSIGVQLWDIQESRPIGQPFTGFTRSVDHLAFTSDGSMLITAGDPADGIKLWDVSPQSWMVRACAIANRNLTQAEWQQFFPPDVPYHKTCL